MPSWVKDDDLWKKAEEVAKKEYGESDPDYYKIVTGIYKKMGGKIEGSTLDAAENKTMLFNFNDLSDKSKAAKLVAKMFVKAGLSVVDIAVSPNVKRSAGISYRELKLGFSDSQTLTFLIKPTGDIYQVKLNDKVIPIKNQDDQVKAVAELVGILSANRAKFQKAMAKALVKLPPTIKTAAPKIYNILVEKRDALKEAIVEVKKELDEVNAQLA